MPSSPTVPPEGRTLMAETVADAFLAYDKALLRFWYGSEDDIAEPKGMTPKMMRALAAAGFAVYKPRNWDEIVEPARAALIAAAASSEAGEG